MSTPDQDLKAAFALLDISNFKWLTDEDLEDLPPLTKKGSMTIPLNQETFEGMKAKSVFTGHWQTQSRTVMKEKRNFRITVRMYQMGVDKYIEANAVMIKPDTVHKAWDAIKEASAFIMGENEGADWNENACIARVKA
ncbi:hypothetical protein ACI2I3_00615 [Psychrobacter namhaensis]|uniref:Uncharacterized protein n=1 Tax=Psychrobacter namhaensis TaxID=292734 RepID=A0ABW8L4M0_9GAMM